jgi:NAD(P)-dependent dehydrogenase (short-subunit alcohol dehydrogenase family)
MRRLEGRVALVTGGASGIGKATVYRLAEEGARVLFTDIQDEAGEEIARHLVELGREASYLHHDVTSQADWERAVEHALTEYAGLDILFNNAGAGGLGAIEETSLEDYERNIAIDQTSVFLGMKIAAEALKQSEHASVINNSSIFGASGGFGTSTDYHAAKGAVRTMTKNVAVHWATQGIRVNSVHPGFVETPIMDQAKGTPFEQMMLDATPMGRLGRPEEIAAVVAFLASDDASFMTGAEVYVDGGYLAR